MMEEESVCHFLGEEKVCAMKRSGEEKEQEEKDRSLDEHMCERGKCRGSTVGGAEVYCEDTVEEGRESAVEESGDWVEVKDPGEMEQWCEYG